jgi:D-glycero-D-manno-heptose 1,7-bisphosphate phosphatase
MSRKAVFLDKDGTLIENRPFDRGSEHIQWLPGTIEGLQVLHRAGYALIVVSNQGGIAQGLFTVEDLLSEELALRAELAKVGVPLSGFYYCPHHPEGHVPSFSVGCDCRKPNPGLLTQAARELNVDLTHSWMIGDILHDVAAGRAAGCRTVLLTNGNETEWDLTPFRWPHFIADEVFEAARLIACTDLIANDTRPCSQDDRSKDF